MRRGFGHALEACKNFPFTAARAWGRRGFGHALEACAEAVGAIGGGGGLGAPWRPVRSEWRQ